MVSVSPRPLGPFPAGVNNLAKETQLPVDDDGNQLALRAAVNVDLDKVGWPSRRRGQVQRVAATRAHSLFITDTSLLAVVDGDLCAYDENLAKIATVRAGIGPRYASFADVAGTVYWSNGIEMRRIGLELEDQPAALATPPQPTAQASAYGGLVAGEYMLALTWCDAEGVESGASAPLIVEVEQGGGILLPALPPAAERATRLRVYVSAPNGALAQAGADEGLVLYRAAELPAGTPSTLINAHVPGPACETLFHAPLPPGQIVRYGHGRLLVATGNTLSWAQSQRGALMHMEHSLRFGREIRLLEPVGDTAATGAGFFLSDHARIYFIAGTGPATWEKSIRYLHPAVPGTSVTAPGTAFGLESAAPVAAWLASNGVFVLGLPGGQVVPLTEGNLALDVGERGAATYREFDGIRQMLTTFLVGGGNAMGVTDSAVATVRRNGVTT